MMMKAKKETSKTASGNNETRINPIENVFFILKITSLILAQMLIQIKRICVRRLRLHPYFMPRTKGTLLNFVLFCFVLLIYCVSFQCTMRRHETMGGRMCESEHAYFVYNDNRRSISFRRAKHSAEHTLKQIGKREHLMCVCCTKSRCFATFFFFKYNYQPSILWRKMQSLYSHACFGLTQFATLSLVLSLFGCVFVLWHSFFFNFYFRAVTHPRCCAFCLFYDSLFYHFILFFFNFPPMFSHYFIFL